MDKKQAIPWAVIGTLLTLGTFAAAYEYTYGGKVTVDDKAYAAAELSASKEGRTLQQKTDTIIQNMLEQPYKTEVKDNFDNAYNAIINRNTPATYEAATECLIGVLNSAEPVKP